MEQVILVATAATGVPKFIVLLGGYIVNWPMVRNFVPWGVGLVINGGRFTPLTTYPKSGDSPTGMYPSTIIAKSRRIKSRLDTERYSLILRGKSIYHFSWIMDHPSFWARRGHLKWW